jgi:hypothetical protein
MVEIRSGAGRTKMGRIGKVDRRSGEDRRTRGGFTFKSLFYNGKREEIRRQEDYRRVFFLDRYSTTIFAAIMAVLFLSIMDALLTLILIDHGAKELNPVMAFFLEIEPKIFMTVKYLLTCTSLVIILIFRNVFVRCVKIYSSTLFSVFIGVFMTVIAWELFLIYRVVVSGTQ